MNKQERLERAKARFEAFPPDVQEHMVYLRNGPFMRNRPDVSLEWIGKYEDFGGLYSMMPPITTAYEEKALLGKIGERFDSPEKVDLLNRFRYQQALANFLLFRTLLDREVLDKIGELSGYGKRVQPLQIGEQTTMAGYTK